nr:MAG TPA: DNA polymerase [Caudoviricetes sp.]
MIFFDTEVFAYDWLLVTFDGKEFTYIENDTKLLQQYYQDHKHDLWIGYNCKGYDQYIIKALLLGINPKLVNDWIIKDGKAGWQFTNKFKDIELNIYDCMVFGKSLKQLESYLGVNIHETDVDFDIKRPLTDEEKRLNREYCRDDVYNTALVFQHTQDDFKAHLGLCQLAGEPISSMAKTKAQLGSKILKAQRLSPKYWDEEYNFEYVQCVKEYDYKHKDVLTFFDSIRDTKNPKSKYDTELYGVPHVFALGGVHGSVNNYFYDSEVDVNHILVHADIGSMYPSIMIQWDLLSRAVPNLQTYIDIREQRLKYKHDGNPLQAPLKILLNSVYGMSGAGKYEDGKYQVLSDVYDPVRMREVCINGQLMILQLIEDLAQFKLIQSNTDGLIYKVHKTELENFKRIVNQWEKRTRLNMEYDYITYMAQRDVNNYIAVFDNGTIERKGGAVKKAKILDNDLPIVSDSVVEYFVNGVDPTEYIMKENNLMRFMKTYKLSSKYSHAIYNDEVLTDKVYRVFASRSRKDGIVYKCKEGGKPEKFASCPVHCKIINGNIQDMTVPNWLDYNFYIKESWRRINSFLGKNET